VNAIYGTCLYSDPTTSNTEYIVIATNTKAIAVKTSDTSVTRQNINPRILTFYTEHASLTLALEGSEFSVPPMAAQPVVTAEASESGSVEGLADEEWVQMYMGTAGESGEMFEGSDEISSVDEAVAEESDGSSLLDSVDAFFRDLSVSS
ncbi:MAG: hypothetical protein ACK53L_34805, partial [Pirellulaceae bacterium]